jgi:amino acid adenylation domain-containing protein
VTRPPLIEGRAVSAGTTAVIPRISRSRPARLSSAQRRLWFAYRLGHTGAEYAYPLAFRIHGELDVEALRRAVDALVDRHEALRTTFFEVDGIARQRVGLAPSGVLTLQTIEDPAALERAVAELVQTPFDLEHGPVFRAALLATAPREHLLVLSLHHIVVDGRSAEILVQELGRGYAHGGTTDEDEPVVQYVDFAAWEQDRLSLGGLATHIEYWRAQLAGVRQTLALPTDYPRPERQTYAGDWLSIHVPAASRRAVAAVALEEGVPEQTVLFAAFALFLSRWTGSEEVVLGLPAPARPASELDELIGFFVNLLPIRVLVDERLGFRVLVRHVHETVENALEYQDVSFDEVVEQLGPERTLAHNPLIQSTFAREELPELELDGLHVEWVDARPRVSRYDVACDYRTAGDRLELELSYASDLFDRSTIESAAARLLSTLSAAFAAPDRPLLELDVVSPHERDRLAAWEQGPAPVPAGSVLARFTDAVRAAPDRRAVVAGGEELTFAELDARARGIAALLCERGVMPEEVVGVSTARSSDLPASILGVLGAGAAYLPLDPTYPAQRLRLVAADAGVRFVLAGGDGAASLREALGAAAVIVDPGDAEGAASTAPFADPRPEQLAYVIYTSGSTGTPKGVCVTHGGVTNLLAALEARGVAPDAPATVAWNASASFDASVQQWARLARGDTLVVLDDVHRSDPDRLAELLRGEDVDELDLTPSHLAAVLDTLPPLRLLVGGEPIRPGLWEVLRARGATAFNLYGPTECTVDATVADVGESILPTIGRPLAGVRAYVLDGWLRRVPEGAYGELYLGGAGVARGYLGQPALTAATFVPDVVAGGGARMYRTGDRARWRNGRLELAGRLDDQVKVRGYRVELGEVASVLESVPGVADAVVVQRDEQDGGGLAAYYTAREELAPAELARALAARLPDFMVPATLTQVDRIPLTDSGKVDRSKLPPPGGDDAAAASEAATPVSDEPSGPIEQLIAEVWAEVLGVDSISANDNFFSLGGHSILAIRVVARLKKRINLSIPMTAVFEYPSVRDLAAYAQSEMLAKLAASGAA